MIECIQNRDNLRKDILNSIAYDIYGVEYEYLDKIPKYIVNQFYKQLNIYKIKPSQ